MRADEYYEIARFASAADATPLERIRLLSRDGALMLRGTDGDETQCSGADIAAVISSTASLREIHGGKENRIDCSLDVAAQLPFLLEPLWHSGNYDDIFAEINGATWMAYPTLDESYVMLPGWDPYEAPEMNPCWAELYVEEGERRPLIGWAAIGLVTAGVAVEYARHDFCGMGGRSAVAITQFDDFATVFVDWLLNTALLKELWEGDPAPHIPAAQLFADAVEAANRRSSWDPATAGGECHNRGCVTWADLDLHLTDELIDLVVAHRRVRADG